LSRRQLEPVVVELTILPLPREKEGGKKKGRKTSVKRGLWWVFAAPKRKKKKKRGEGGGGREVRDSVVVTPVGSSR